MDMDSTPSVSVKRKNIQTVMDYCLENKIEFTVKSRFASSDEWDIELNISDINKAIIFGMFLRENKLELNGHSLVTPAVTASHSAPAARGSKKSEPKENGHSKAEPAGLSFGEEPANVEFNIDSSVN